MEKKPDEPEEDAMQARENLARTASLADLEEILRERANSGETPVAAEEVWKDLGL